MVTSADNDILQELQFLRETVDKLKSVFSANSRVALQCDQTGPYLGQPVTVVIKVTDILDRNPRINIPISVITTWGKLCDVRDLSGQYSNALTTRTDTDGTITLTLVPPTTVNLLDVQQAALLSMLNTLDPTAQTPAQVAAALETMSRQYRWEAAVDFRDAVDIYFHNFCGEILNTINQKDYLQEWEFINSTIFAFTANSQSEEEAGTSVLGSGVATLKYRNWIGPWLETYLKLTENESALSRQLKDAAQPDVDSSSILDNVYDQVNDFLGKHPGKVGQVVGQKVADGSLRDFTVSTLTTLPLATQTSLLPGIQSASTTVTKSGALQFKDVVQIRAGLKQEATTRAAAEVTASVGAAQTRLNDAAASSLKDFSAQLAAASADSTKTHQAQLDNSRANSVKTFQTQLDTNRADSVKAFQVQLDTGRADSAKAFQLQLDTSRTDSVRAFQVQIDKNSTDSIKAHQVQLDTTRATSLKTHQAQLDVSRISSASTHQLQLDSSRTASVKALEIEAKKLGPH